MQDLIFLLFSSFNSRIFGLPFEEYEVDREIHHDEYKIEFHCDNSNRLGVDDPQLQEFHLNMTNPSRCLIE